MGGLFRGARVKVRIGKALADGTVLDVRADSVIVVLDRPNLTTKVSFDSIILSETQPLRPEVAFAPTRPSDFETTDVIQRRKSLESLRFGLVPSHAIEEMTVGLETIKEWIINRLPGASDEPTVSEVCGEYGTGKSHTMALVRHVARNQNYVTAHVEINGKDVSLEDPEMLSSHLWKSLEAEGLESDTPLVDIYLKALERKARFPDVSSGLIDKTRDNYNTLKLLKDRGVVENLCYDYNSLLSCSNEITAIELRRRLCAQPGIICIFDNPKVRKPIGRRVNERPRDFVESLVGVAIVSKLAGFKGLVITIDEFEIQQLTSRLDRVFDLVVCLTKYFKGESNLPVSPLGIFFASVSSDGRLGNAIIKMLIEGCGGGTYPLSKLHETDCLAIGKNIFELYKEVHNGLPDFDEPLASKIYQMFRNEEGLVRKFIKYFVATLDKRYGPPAQR